MKITVYQTFNGYRVVAGEHRKAVDHINIQPRTYDSPGEAYRVETNDSIRAMILRIDPAAAQDSTPATRHHVVTRTEQRLRSRLLTIDVKCVNCGHKFKAESAPDMPPCPKCYGPVTVVRATSVTITPKSRR